VGYVVRGVRARRNELRITEQLQALINEKPHGP
jgi:hypothetical protein